jgi:putative FmdB family regulatory protein
MPVYEYVCNACSRKSSLFFKSITAVEVHPECPRCGERQLVRRMSRFWTTRAGTDRDDDLFGSPSFEHEGIPFYGGDPSMLEEGYAGGDDGDDAGDDEDVASLAREARAMSMMMGEPLDAEFDSALRSIEQGADPDDVFGEMDEQSVPHTQDDEI